MAEVPAEATPTEPTGAPPASPTGAPGGPLAEPVSTPAATPAPAVPATPASADWRTAITDADLKKHAERFQSVEDVIKANLDSRQKLSRAVVVPGKDAKPEEVAAFHKALGVPEKADGYEIPKHEMFEADAAKARLGTFAETAQKLNISKDAFKGVLDWYVGEVSRIQADQAAEDQAFAEQSIADLRKDWPSFDREKAYADRGAEWALGDAFQDFTGLKTADGRFVADHPVVLKMLNKIGRAISEDSIGVFPVDEQTASGLKEKLAQLTAEQSDAMARGEREKAMRLDTEIMRIAGQISGDGPIVGADGRTA